MHNDIRQWIREILRDHAVVAELALSQRAKFEGWLKFELAAKAMQAGAESVMLEALIPDGGQARCDMAIHHHDVTSLVELKTPNGNWRIPHVMDRGRPITANIDAIIEDAAKMARSPVGGIVAFVLFPVPPGDQRWENHVDRIGAAVGLDLSNTYSERVGCGLADSIVCSFPVQPRAGNDV